MNKKILNIFVITCVLLLLFIKIITLIHNDNDSTDTYEEIPKKNVCLALTYHYIRNPTLWNVTLEKLTGTKELTKYTVYKDEFEKQINELVEAKAYFATLDEIRQFRKTGNYPDKCVWICFDDGDESIYENAFPILKEKKIPFTMFIIAGQVGNKDFNNLELASWDELREIRDSGLASFGSHTYDMHYVDDNQAKFLNEDEYGKFAEDIKKSKEVIEKELGIDVTSIAYPFGNTDDTITKIVSDSGFTDAFILAPHPLTEKNSPYYQNRYLIDKNNFYKIVVPWLEKNNEQ